MKSICKIAILLIALLHVVKIFVPVDLLPILFVVTILFFICGFPMQGKGFKKISLFFLLIGCVILTYYELPIVLWMKAFVSMTNLVAIIVVMQLFTLPIELGEYSKTIEFWLKKSFKKESSLFLFTMFVTHVFSSFLMFGTVPVIVSLFSKALQNNISNYQRFLAVAIVRGYAMVLFWAPGAVMMLLVLQVTNITWFELFFPSFLLSLIGIGTAYLLEHVTRLNKPILAAVTKQIALPETVTLAYKQSVHIFLVVVGLLVLIAFFETFSVGSGTGRILLAGLLVAGLWLLYYRDHDQFSSVFYRYWENGVMKSVDLSVLFIAMGLFAGAIDQSGILIQLQPILQNVINQLGLFSIIAVPIIYIFFAMTGIHPLILTVIFGKILMTLALPLPAISIALLLLLAGTISFTLSPFAGMALMTAKFLNVKPIDVAVKWNAVFGGLFFVEGIIFICLWGGTTVQSIR